MQITKQVRRTESFLELYQIFLDNNLHPIVMKGIICRMLFGDYADCRISADEDLLIRAEDYGAVKSILESRGYCSEFVNIKKDHIDEVHEIEFYSQDTELCIDLHVNPMGCENVLLEEMNECFVDIFSNYRECDVNGMKLRTLNHTDHYLFLVLHALKHFTDGGFGIRQVLDILLYQEQFGTEINWDYFYSKISNMNAELFWSDIVHIGNRYMGFALKIPYEPNCPEDMLEDLIRGGIFGNEEQVQRTASEMTRAVIANRDSNRRTGKISTMVHTVFPSKAQMVKRHPEIQEKPWKLYIEWVKRWRRFLKHSKENEGNLAMESMKISQRRIDLLKKYKIL